MATAPYYRCVGGDIIGRYDAYVPLWAVGGLLDTLVDEAVAARAAGYLDIHDRYVAMGRDLMDASTQARRWAKASGGVRS